MSVSSTYADALFEAASDKDAVSEVADQLDGFARSVEESTELSSVLGDPNLDAGSKKAVITRLTADGDPLVSNFLQVLVDRGRLADLAAISTAFQSKVAEAQGRIEITAITAIPLDDELRQKILRRIEQQIGRTAELTERVDEDLIGGIVLEVGEIRVDGSVRHRLDALGRKLANAPIGSGS